MTSVSKHDVRTRSGEVWQQLRAQGHLIVTASGRPFALMIAAEGEDVEALLLALRRARAQLAVSNIRKQAGKAGLVRISIDEVDDEIRQARTEATSLS